MRNVSPIPRPRYLEQIRTALRRAPVVALLGPRQCGKTTLARMLAGTGRPRSQAIVSQVERLVPSRFRREGLRSGAGFC